MNSRGESDSKQAALWNGDAGSAWVETQALLDHMFKPIEALLVDAISSEPGQQVLDVGCGTGATTIAVARRLGGQGHCLGVDISAPMIAAARGRAEQEKPMPSFLCEDVQRYAFKANSFDSIISRFGVMFFDDSVAAFSNLRQAARPHGQLRFIAWRSAAENPFMTAAERAAASLLPQVPARQADEPGQFAFARRERIDDILHRSGWAGVHIEPIDVVCSFPESGLLSYLTRMGPLGRVLQAADGQTRERVIETVRPAFEPYVQADKVIFTAACWDVGAQAE